MKEKILESALKKIQQYGLRRFTMDDIAQDLGISKKTLYLHFSSKSELITTVISESIALEKQAAGDALARGESWLEKLDAVLSVHAYANIPYGLVDEINRFFPEENEQVKEMLEYKLTVLRQLLQEGMQEGQIRPDVNLEIILLTLKKVFHTPTEEEFLVENDLTINQLLQQLKTICFYGSLKEERG